MRFLIVLVSLSFMLSLSGCQSTPEVIEPIELNTKFSDALNIANQTYLTKEYEFGLRTIKSPLKDFTPKEIEETKTKLTKNSAGSASILFGALSLLSGDLTGAIDIAGGTAANISQSDHVSANSQWIVALDAANFSDGIEAKKYANTLIQSVAMQLLKEKGNEFQKVYLRKEGKATLTGAKLHSETSYVIKNTNKLFGFYNNEYYADKGGLLLGRTNLIPSEKQYVSGRESLVFGGIGDFIHFVNGNILGYEGIDGYEQYLLDLTKRLPEGFYFYMPSFPKTTSVELTEGNDWECILCKDYSVFRLLAYTVPSIYTEGKKLQFITPKATL